MLWPESCRLCGAFIAAPRSYQQWEAASEVGPDRTVARYRRFRGQDRASNRLEQRQIVVAASKGQSKQRLTAPKRKTRRVCRYQRIPLLSSLAASEPERASCRHRWGPHSGDQRQDVGERLPRNG